eukprot:TRINITY_DN39556_c0_g1_i1.p1 TRINITY_DN39556_c0_g1~~TRINITY_DN39556_c0_g1_i1.p1  ORF type:complete len:438 (+),score=147.48 TRINITY_DN39556_c0_g1_i1:59-1372(+)
MARVEQSGLAPAGYYAFQSPKGESDLRGAAEYVFGVPAARAALGDPADASVLTAAEVGDGNLNLVFIVRCGDRGVVLKQALPYVKCVGEGWPLSLQRCAIEYKALAEQHRMDPEHTPKVYHLCAEQGIMIMQYIDPPHRILRGAFMEQQRFETVAKDVGTFLGRTLFLSSDLHLPSDKKRAAEVGWDFPDLARLTESVVFTDPFIPKGAKTAFPNRCSPGLEDTAAELASDRALKVAVLALKRKFLSSREALIHGDLHSGSVMAKNGSTQVIDPEFAMYGPMGFDVGAFQANVLLGYFGHFAHGKEKGEDRSPFMDWLLEVLCETWAAFESTFVGLWNDPATRTGDLCAGAAEQELQLYQAEYMQQLFRDTLGFAGCKMIRRCVGVAHVEDLESVKDDAARVAGETRVIALARRMVTSPHSFLSFSAVAAEAKKLAQ